MNCGLTGDTPVFVMRDGVMNIVRVDDLGRAWKRTSMGVDSSNSAFKVWSESGWQDIRAVTRTHVTKQHRFIDMHNDYGCVTAEQNLQMCTTLCSTYAAAAMHHTIIRTLPPPPAAISTNTTVAMACLMGAWFAAGVESVGAFHISCASIAPILSYRRYARSLFDDVNTDYRGSKFHLDMRGGVDIFSCMMSENGKIVPAVILNAEQNIREAFCDGVALFNNNVHSENMYITDNRVALAGLHYLLASVRRATAVGACGHKIVLYNEKPTDNTNTVVDTCYNGDCVYGIFVDDGNCAAVGVGGFLVF